MADVEMNLETNNPDELTGLGIRAFAIGDFSNAAAAFAKASQVISEKNGDEHDSLGEVLVHYARSLLEVSREEAEPLGDAIPRDEEDSSSEDDETPNGNDEAVNGNEEKEKKDGEKEAGDEKAGEEEKKEDEKKDGAEKKENGEGKVDEEKKENGAEETVEKTETENEESKANGEIATNGEPGTSDENQEPASDLQIAWEVLEVAKKIFTKRGDPGRDLLAETHILLGEVAMESENFQDGIQDMTKGIEIQKEIYEPTCRKLAGSYYKLGIVHSTVSNIDEAIECFNNSIDILKKRITMLKEAKEKENKANEEIEEIEKLIPEIEEKIADTKSIKEEMATKLIQEMTGEKKTPTKDEESSSSSKANDISHLVKRKRKADEEPTGTAQPTKRPTP